MFCLSFRINPIPPLLSLSPLFGLFLLLLSSLPSLLHPVTHRLVTTSHAPLSDLFICSVSACNSLSYPPFLVLSLHHDFTRLNLAPPQQSFWMQILECDKSLWFLSGHFAVATENQTLNTTPTQLFTAPSIHTHSDTHNTWTHTRKHTTDM